MFSHIMLGANNIEESKRFYDAIMQSLGYDKGVIDDKGRCVYLTDSGRLLITKPINGEPATHGNGSTIGFSVSSPELADAWHKAGLENGGKACENPPGIRGEGAKQIYLAYLRDPSGNKICATYFVGS